MRFSVKVAVLASPLVCLLAVLALDDSVAQPPSATVRVASGTDPVVTGSFDPGGIIRLDPVLRRWRTAMRLTPQQAGVWAGLEPGTARALAAGPRVAREICAEERSGDPDRRAAAERRRGEWQARFTPLRRNWDRLAQELSPRQDHRYRGLIAPRLDAAFSVRCPTRAGVSGDVADAAPAARRAEPSRPIR